MPVTENTKAPVKKKKSVGPRTIFAVLRGRDADGNTVKLEKSSIDVVLFTSDSKDVLAEIERDPNLTYVQGLLRQRNSAPDV